MHPAAPTIALLLADARLPAGGHAHSSGLEPALLAGLSPAEVRGFLFARARTTTLVDAATSVVARHAALAGTSLAEVERAWAARTPSGAMRQAARDLGRGLLRLARRVWPQSGPLASLAPAGAPPRPIVLGAVAAAAGLDAETLVRLAVYDDMACAVAALLKLEPGDPGDGVALVLDACGSVEGSISELASLASPDQIPAASAPQAEAWAESHALTNRRLFRA